MMARHRSTYVFTGLCGLLCIGLNGCPPPPPPADGTNAGLPAPRATDVGTPSGDPVEKTIGAAGGSLASADGLLSIDVPAGALAADTQLGIQPLTNTAPNGLGPGFRLTPHGVNFASPVTLTFKPTTEQLGGTVLALTGIGFQDASGFWRWMGGVARDEANGRVSVPTTHFSDFSYLAGAQLRPPRATVQTGQTLELRAVVCYAVEDPDGLGPRFDSADAEGQIYPVSLTNKLSNWAVNAVAGGNDAVGTITGVTWRTASFTAPQSRPDPAIVAASVDVANLTLYGQTFPKAILVSNVTVIDAGDVTWRGPVTFSWSEVDGRDTTSWQAEGTVEFGQPYDNSTFLSFGTPENGSPCQISNYRKESTYTWGVETCIGNAEPWAFSMLGTLVVRKSPSEHGLTLLFEGTMAGTMPSTCTNQWNSTQVAQDPRGQVGYDNDGYGNPIGCGGMKFTPSPPDARRLTGSASWSCTTTTNWGTDRSYTATLTWDLTRGE